MLYLGILCNFMSIFLIFALSKINYARTLLNFPRMNILAMAKSLTKPELKPCNANELLSTNS